MSCADVAKVAAGHAKTDALVVAFGSAQIACDVVHDLGDDASPVDAVYGADAVALFEFGIVLHGFDDVLAVVKHTVHGDVDDVFVLQAIHLGALEGGHFAIGREHEHVDAAFAAQGVFGGGACVAAGCAEDVERLVFFGEHVFEGVAQELHRHVFEREGGAVGQGLDFDAVFERAHGGDFCATECVAGVGAVDDAAQVVFGDVGGEQADDFKGEFGVAEGAPMGELLGGDLGVLCGEHKTAVGGEPHKQGLAECFGGGVAAGADVVHKISFLSFLNLKIAIVLFRFFIRFGT